MWVYVKQYRKRPNRIAPLRYIIAELRYWHWVYLNSYIDRTNLYRAVEPKVNFAISYKIHYHDATYALKAYNKCLDLVVNRDDLTLTKKDIRDIVELWIVYAEKAWEKKKGYDFTKCFMAQLDAYSHVLSLLNGEISVYDFVTFEQTFTNQNDYWPDPKWISENLAKPEEAEKYQAFKTKLEQKLGERNEKL